jgi:hypothetical protein
MLIYSFISEFQSFYKKSRLKWRNLKFNIKLYIKKKSYKVLQLKKTNISELTTI